MAECRECHGPIRFVRIINTQNMLPIDPVPDERGNVWAWRRDQYNWDALVLSPGYVLEADDRPAIGSVMKTALRPRSDAQKFMPHHATCPAVPRKKQSRPKPRSDDTLF